MAKQEENVQACSTRLIQHIKNVIGIHAVTVILGTHIIVEGQMGNDKNRLGIAGIPFGIQVALQIRRSIFNEGLVLAFPVIVLLIDNKDAIVFGIISTAFVQNRSNQSSLSATITGRVVMVALDQDKIIVCQLRICRLNGTLQRSHIGYFRCTAAIVTGKQETIHCGVSCTLNFRNNGVNIRFFSSITTICLEV